MYICSCVSVLREKYSLRTSPLSSDRIYGTCTNVFVCFHHRVTFLLLLLLLFCAFKYHLLLVARFSRRNYPPLRVHEPNFRRPRSQKDFGRTSNSAAYMQYVSRVNWNLGCWNQSWDLKVLDLHTRA